MNVGGLSVIFGAMVLTLVSMPPWVFVSLAAVCLFNLVKNP